MRRNAGTDATEDNLFTDGDPNTSTPASVVGSDILNIIQEELCTVVEEAGLTVDQENDFPDNNTGQLAAAIRLLGGSGGGGGFQWYPVAGEEPIEDTEFSTRVFMFQSGASQKLKARLKVPQGYQDGNPISIFLALYSPSTSGTMLMQATATLIKKDTTAMDSTSNQHSSTNAQLVNSAANQYRETQIDLTDEDGEINNVAVEAGDIIDVVLTRGTDTDTADVRVIPEATEPKFT